MNTPNLDKVKSVKSPSPLQYAILLYGDEQSASLEDLLDAERAASLLATMQARIEKVCEWGLLEDEEWETSCNETIYMEGLPDEDWKFCPFCGGKIKALK